MYEDAYDLNESERRQVEEIIAGMSLHGRLADSTGRPIAYRVLRGRRWLVCERGLLWRYAPEGSPQVPGTRGGALRRNGAVEMWTGRWRKVAGADGTIGYAKQIIWVPIDSHVNGHAGIGKFAWYRSVKGFAHPFEDPAEPTDEQIAELEGRRAEADRAVYARMMAEGLATDVPSDESGTDGKSDTAAKRGSRRNGS